MTAPLLWATVSLAMLAGVAIVAMALLKGWRDWIGLQRLVVEGRRDVPPLPSSEPRIQLADLKERVRRLEAIAAGVDL